MPSGPFGGPRPFSNTETIIQLEIQDERVTPSEVAIESQLRHRIGPALDVVVSESFEHEGVTVTVIISAEKVSLGLVQMTQAVVGDMVDSEISENSVHIKSR